MRKEKRTRGHLFVTMLAYILVHEFRRRTAKSGRTLDDMISSLEQIQTVTLALSENIKVKKIPEQNAQTQKLLEMVGCSLPKIMKE